MQHCIQSFLSKRNAGKASVGVATLPAVSVCKHWQDKIDQRCWERVTGRGSYTLREALHSQDSKADKAFQGPLQRQDKAFKGWTGLRQKIVMGRWLIVEPDFLQM